MEAIFQAASNFVKMIRISDLVDIAILSMLIYKLIWMTRKNSFGRVIKGVGVVLVVMIFASSFKLYAVSYLFSIVVEWGVLALIIVFQPEIRRILDHVGSMSLSKVLKLEHASQEMENVINQTIMACERMSKERVGALIVFARDNTLDEYAISGTEVDARLSEQLLRNIFFPKAALHDGAVIVREGRVLAAGCVLPLSESKNLHTDLGTRHRAGLGISEVSDAVTIIVSEETGGISVTVGGVLKKNLAPQTVARLLRNELMPNEEEESEDKQALKRLKQKLMKSGKEGRQ